MFTYPLSMDLPLRQKAVLDFIRDFQGQNGVAPSVREIAAHLGRKSPGGVHRILKALEAKGLLVTSPGKKRAWRLPQGPPHPAIPLLGRIAAGLPIHAEENREEDLPVAPQLFGTEACFALRVQGDSMIDAHIADRDIAIIRPQDDADDGQIVAVLVDGLLPEATLKILRRAPGTLTLQAANSRYPPLLFTQEEQARVHILGVLTGIIRVT